jgi:zinc transporter ZupT
MEALEPWVPLAVQASLLAAIVATIGLVTVLAHDRWARHNQIYFTAFAAGILVTTALFLFPKALAINDRAPLLALAGYLILYGINTVSASARGAMFVPLFAIGVHSFIDGLEYGVLFEHDEGFGWIASIGLISHEFAEGVILYALLRAAKVGTGTAVVAAFFGAALTTPLGALASQPLLAHASEDQVGMLLAAAAGALLYLGATHLPVQLSGQRRDRMLVVYLIGVTVSLVLATLVHSH